MAETPTPPQGRRERRKAETRARLIVSARELFAAQGVEATPISEITEAADVGFGSFYNYFEGKEAVVAAVAEAVAVEAGEAIAAATSEIKDAAEVVATGHRAILAQVVRDPSLGWLMVRLELSHGLVTQSLGPFALRDLQRGIDARRFDVDDPATALIASGGALLAMVRALLQGISGVDAERAGQQHAAYVLRMLGVAPDEAREIAARPLTDRVKTELDAWSR